LVDSVKGFADRNHAQGLRGYVEVFNFSNAPKDIRHATPKRVLTCLLDHFRFEIDAHDIAEERGERNREPARPAGEVE
jgi:hypothetical protein